MFDFIARLFDTSDFSPRWFCGNWTPGHGWLHILSDLGVWSAYVAIPCVLGYFVLRRKDIPFRMIFWLFGAFILACGTTHLMEAVIFWWPAYRLAGVIKLFTAVVSWGTVMALIPVVPKVLAMRSPEELEREIVARKKAENALQQVNAELEMRVEALRTSEERFRLLVDGTKDHAIFMLDTTGRIDSWNPGAERIKQYRANEIVGRNFSCLYPAVDIESSKPERQLRVAATEGKYEEEGWRIRKDGTQFWASVVITALHDEAGHLRGFSKVTRDLTQKKQAEEYARRLLQEETARNEAEKHAQVIAEQREQLRVTLRSIGDGVIATHADGRVTLLNPVAEALTGWTSEDAAGQPLQSVFRIINELTRQTVENPVAKVLTTGRIVGLANHTVLIAKDGTERPIDDSAAPIRDQQGRLAGVVLVFRDIAARRQEEEERRKRVEQLAEAEERIRAVVDHIIDGIITIDDSGTVQSLNPAGEKLFGYKGEEVVGQNVRMLMPDPYRSGHDGYIANFLRTGQAKIIGIGREVEGRRKDGSTFPMDLAVSEFRLGDHRYFTGIVRDITEPKQAIEALRESERRVKERADEVDAILRATPTPIWIALDPQCHRITGNPASFKLLGLPEGANVSATSPVHDPGVRGFREYRDDEPIPEDELPVQMAAKGIRVNGAEVKFVFDDGSVRYIYGNAEPLFNPDGSARGCVAAFADVTPLKEAEKALKEADRRKDEFLATLAHELRNPLAPIRNAVELLRRGKGDVALLEQARSVMERQLAQLVRLVDDLLDVSRITKAKLELRRERVDLAAVLSNAVEEARPLIEAQSHELTVTPPKEPIYLDADPARLAQIISNLLNNAAKYTEEGGHIWLIAMRQDAEAVISVRDSGVGIPTEHLPNIFKMFSQVVPALERSSGGLGIGLSLVQGLVQLHGGSVEARSDGPGKGSEFIVRLPVGMAAQEALQEPVQDSEQKCAVTHRILVVDDLEDSADSMTMVLRVMGHEVETAYDGEQAVAMAAAFRPEVVLLDIGMPKLNGYETARSIREQSWGKEMVLVAMTGWGQEEDRRRTKEAGFNHHLVKPVDPDALQSLLADLKSSRGQRGTEE